MCMYVRVPMYIRMTIQVIHLYFNMHFASFFFAICGVFL